MAVYHATPGTIPLVALNTMGISVKVNENPIGKFGTGFSYALAGILRLGGRVTILQPNGAKHKFTKRREVVRGREFNIVQMDGRDLGFSTDLGAHWEPWMFYRELHSNTLDERGWTKVAKSGVSIPEGWAVVMVECLEYERIAKEANNVFLTGEPVHSSGYADIHAGESSLVYYRGVRVYDLGLKLPVTVNLKEATLTEDRTLAYEHGFWDRFAYTLRNAPLNVLDAVLLDDRSDNYVQKLSWTSVLSSDKLMDWTTKRIAEGDFVPPALRTVHKRLAARSADTPAVLDAEDKAMLEEAITKIRKMGYTSICDADKVVITKSIGNDALGMADGTVIKLHPRIFGMGLHQVMATLLEEFVHNYYRLEDCSRNMQEWLLNELVKQGLRAINAKAG